MTAITPNHIGSKPKAIIKGYITVMVIQMGLVTPPVGFEVYILSGVTNVPVSTIFRGVAPFCIAIIICIIILVIFPQIALFLPGTMMR